MLSLPKNCLTLTQRNGGVANYCDNPSSLGYSTTITPDTIQAAVDREVDVIVTHHDAWDFMFEQKEEVHALLRDKSLTHIWAHLPLDLADFGTSATLLSEMGCSPVATMTKVEGRIGELPRIYLLVNSTRESQFLPDGGTLAASMMQIRVFKE